jgi:hypothetical protein
MELAHVMQSCESTSNENHTQEVCIISIFPFHTSDITQMMNIVSALNFLHYRGVFYSDLEGVRR